MKKLLVGIISVYSLSWVSIALAKDEPLDLGVIDVVGVTPLSNDGMAVEKISTPIQHVASEQLQKSQSISLADYMNRYLSGVSTNEAQNNPLQPDIFYRGFVASPLLGMPQGLSTYVNGVRFNEPFGDTVNWDLIPQNAIDTMTLYSGSNPVYGLNSLGGAISVKTKTGFSVPTHQLEVYGGSYDRHSEDLTSGWNNGTWGYFIDLNHFEDGGWRNYSPTKADRVFSTLSWRGDKGSLDLTLGANDNNMRGNGPAPIQLVQQQRNAVFTQYDQTITRMFFSELQGSYDVSDTIEVSGNAYFRQNRMSSFNGDGTNYQACSFNGALLCDANDVVVIDTKGQNVNTSPAVDTATNNFGQTNMRSRGGTVQTVFAKDLFEHENNLTVGVNYDYATVNFSSDTELAALTDTRGTHASGILVDDSKVRLHTNTSSVGVYLTDSFSITDALTATIAGRYNYIHVNMMDKYINNPLQTLDGSHTFERLNPSAGLTYQVLSNVNLYGNYSESTRAPSPIELSCADPAAPCKLPNSFVSDPELKQVVAKTWEAGVRGNVNNLLTDGDTKWNVGFFHTINHDDIIFRRDATSRVISQGYFSNVGKTRRYGIEAGSSIDYPHLFSKIDDWHFSTNYTYLNARFLSDFDSINPLNADQIQVVRAGSKIPSIPEHSFKAALSVDLWQKLSLGINGAYSGDRYLRGDEANTHAKLAGYWLFNATADYKITKNFTVFGKLDNIFDNNYNSFGVYGDATGILGPNYNDARFVSTGMPRAGWIGVRLSL